MPKSQVSIEYMPDESEEEDLDDLEELEGEEIEEEDVS